MWSILSVQIVLSSAWAAASLIWIQILFQILHFLWFNKYDKGMRDVGTVSYETFVKNLFL